METREAVVGASRKFECQVVGYPPPLIRWFKDEAEITHDMRYKFSHEARDGTVSMHIDNIRLTDSGLYKCRAENCEGYAITAAHLTVRAAEPKKTAAASQVDKVAPAEDTVRMKVVQEVFQKSGPTEHSQSRRRPLTMQSSTETAPCAAPPASLVPSSPPVFVKKPESLTVTEAQSVALSCQVQGTPKPVVTWFHEGKLLQPDCRRSFSTIEDAHVLIIDHCLVSDAGEYMCTATNAVGAVCYSCLLTVADALSEEGSSSDSEYSSSSYRRLSAVVEEGSSTDTLSDKPNTEANFLREMVVTTQYADSGKKITLKQGDVVEVLDTAKTDRWLVRSKNDSLQVCYIPRGCLGSHKATGPGSATHQRGPCDADDVDPSKSPIKQKDEKPGKAPSPRKARENEDSSGDETSSPDAEVFPVFVAIADYESDDLRICEGQFLEVVDRSNPLSWRVRTKPTKTNPSRVGWMPASYLQMKDGVGPVDRRSTREVFREDIIQITDKNTEASVKRRYALTELLESEKDYVADMEELINQLRSDTTSQIAEKDRVLEELQEFHCFHKESFLPDLMQCTGSPADVADAFLSWKSGRSASESSSTEPYFETPLRHVKKYVSLLKDFVRYTARSGGDCERLEKALNVLLYVTKCIDDQEVMQQLKGCPLEVLAQKPLLRHESIIMWGSDDDGSKGKDRHLFLFPENLLITRSSKTGALLEEYHYKESLPLSRIRINDSVASDDKKFELYLTNIDDSCELYVVQTKNDFSKEAWLRDLENTLRAQGIENCYISEKERHDVTQRKRLPESSTASTKESASRPPVTESHPAPIDYSTGNETDQYLTAAESEVSSYCTAQESADDDLDDAKQKGKQNHTELPSPPTFSQPLMPVVSVDGTSARFDCVIAGHPQPSVCWYFQGRTIAEDGHYTFTISQQCHYAMAIHDLTVDDAGLYTIQLINAHGEASSQAELKVDPPVFSHNNPIASASSLEGQAVALASESNGFDLSGFEPGDTSSETQGQAEHEARQSISQQGTKDEGADTAAAFLGDNGPFDSWSEAHPRDTPIDSVAPALEDAAGNAQGADGEQESVEPENSGRSDAAAALGNFSGFAGSMPAPEIQDHAARVEVTSESPEAAVSVGADQPEARACGYDDNHQGMNNDSEAEGSYNQQPTREPKPLQCDISSSYENIRQPISEPLEAQEDQSPSPGLPETVKQKVAASEDMSSSTPAALFDEGSSEAFDSSCLTISACSGDDSASSPGASGDDALTGTDAQSGPRSELDISPAAAPPSDFCSDSAANPDLVAEERTACWDFNILLQQVASNDDCGHSSSLSNGGDVATDQSVVAGDGMTKPDGVDAETSEEIRGVAEPESIDAETSEEIGDTGNSPADVDADRLHVSPTEGLAVGGSSRKGNGEHDQNGDFSNALSASLPNVAVEPPDGNVDFISEDSSASISASDDEQQPSNRPVRLYSRANANVDLVEPADVRRKETGDARQLDGSFRQGVESQSQSNDHGRRREAADHEDRDRRRTQRDISECEDTVVPRVHAARVHSPTFFAGSHSSRFYLGNQGLLQAALTVRPLAAHPRPLVRPSAPPLPISEKPEVRQAGADQFVLFWIAPESHRDVCMNISYIIEYRSTSDPDWQRHGRRVRDSCIKLDIPAKQTQYRILAENEYGCSDPSLIVNGPWKRPKVKRSASLTTPSLSIAPHTPPTPALLRRLRTRSCDRLPFRGPSMTTDRSLLDSSPPLPSWRQLSGTFKKRAYSCDREIARGDALLAGVLSGHRAPLLPLPGPQRRRLGDLEQEMSSQVESILNESCFRLSSAARSRSTSGNRYRSQSECRQPSPITKAANFSTRYWDELDFSSTSYHRAQKRLVMPTMAPDDGSSEQRDYKVADYDAYVYAGRHERAFSEARGQISYRSSYARESGKSDFDYVPVGRQRQCSVPAYHVDSSAGWRGSWQGDGDYASRSRSHGQPSPPVHHRLPDSLLRSAKSTALDNDFFISRNGRYSLDMALDQSEVKSSTLNPVPLLTDDLSFAKGTDSVYWTPLLVGRSASVEGDSSSSEVSYRSAPDEDLALAPRFAKNRDSDDQYAIEGRTARVVCTVYTHSRSSITWYRDDAKILIDDGERYNSFVYPSGLCMLEFEDMRWEDAGTYEVVVRNDYGVASRCIRLRVADPPTFLELPSLSMKLSRFDGLKIACKVDGIPPPRVSFFKDSQKVACSPRVQIEAATDGTWSLTVKNVLLRDAGRYTVVAENVGGENRFSVLVDVDEGCWGPQVDQTSGYLFEDHYYVQEEVERDANCTVNRVIEKSSGLEFYARTYRDLASTARGSYWQQLAVARAVSTDAVINIINIIENENQFIVVTELTGTKLSDHMVMTSSWSENLVAYYMQQLLAVSECLYRVDVTLANLQLENIYISTANQKMKVDVYKSGWQLTSATGRSEYKGSRSLFSAPEAAAGEACAVTGMWNLGVIAYLLLGGIPCMNDDGSVNVNVDSLRTVTPDAQDFISHLLQRETCERLSIDEATRHPWLKCAAPDGFGIKLDLSGAQEFVIAYQEQLGLRPRSPRWLEQLSQNRENGKARRVEQQQQQQLASPALGPQQEAWLVDWFSDYKLPSGDAYAVPIHELSLPLALQKRMRWQTCEDREGEEAMWCSRMRRIRQLLSSRADKSEDTMHAVELGRNDLVQLATKGMANLESRVTSAAVNKEPATKLPIYFCQKLETAAFKLGHPFTLRCRLESSSGGDRESPAVSWYKNEELLGADIRPGSTVVSDRYELSHFWDGRLELRLRCSSMPHDAACYRCVARLKKSSVTTRCRLLAGDVPSQPGRPVASSLNDGQVCLIWAEPESDNNGYIRLYRVDSKATDDSKWTIRLFTALCSAVVVDLKMGTTYKFRISAINQFGYGPYSVASSGIQTALRGPALVPLSKGELQTISDSQTAAVEHARSSCMTLQGLEDEWCSSRVYGGVQLKSLNPKLLYHFTDKKISGGLYECFRLDDRRSYSWRLVPHTSSAVREFELDRSLSRHPHLVNLLDAYELPTSHLLLIHEPACRETVLQRLARTKMHYGEQLVKDIVRQVTDAVQYLHHRDIVHSGVHPENVVMAHNSGWRVLLCGFDRIQLQSAAAAAAFPTRGSSATVVRFPEFAAPEVIFHEGSSCQTDVWGLGVIAFALICGHSPFYSSDEQDMLEHIQHVRYWTGDQPAHITMHLAHTFIYQTLKRQPSNRLTAAAAGSHGWLNDPAPCPAEPRDSSTVATTAVEFSGSRLKVLASRLKIQAETLDAKESRMEVATPLSILMRLPECVIGS